MSAESAKEKKMREDVDIKGGVVSICCGGFVGQRCLALPFLFIFLPLAFISGAEIVEVEHPITGPLLTVRFIEALADIAHVKGQFAKWLNIRPGRLGHTVEPGSPVEGVGDNIS